MKNEKFPLNFILLHVGYAEHHADWNWKNINSPFTRLHFVTKGSASIHRADGVIHLQENHLYLTPAYTPHSYVCNNELSLYYIHIYEQSQNGESIFDKIEFPTALIGDELIHLLISRLHKINPKRELTIYDPISYDNSTELKNNITRYRHNPAAIDIENKAIIQQILARYLIHGKEKHPSTDKRVIRVLDYIHKNINAHISIDELAEISCLNKDHFIRCFKKELKYTPNAYINRKKIEKAQLMILLNNIGIQDIAYKLGFNNVSYFNRLFKKLTGVNPKSYRQRQKLTKEISP